MKSWYCCMKDSTDIKKSMLTSYCKAIINIGQVKSTKADLYQFADTLTCTISGLKHTGQYDIESILTSLLASSISKPLQVEWEVHSQDHKNVPPVNDFLKFIRFRASVLSASPPVKVPDIKSEPPARKYKAAVVGTAHMEEEDVKTAQAKKEQKKEKDKEKGQEALSQTVL